MNNEKSSTCVQNISSGNLENILWNNKKRLSGFFLRKFCSELQLSITFTVLFFEKKEIFGKMFTITNFGGKFENEII